MFACTLHSVAGLAHYVAGDRARRASDGRELLILGANDVVLGGANYLRVAGTDRCHPTGVQHHGEEMIAHCTDCGHSWEYDAEEDVGTGCPACDDRRRAAEAPCDLHGIASCPICNEPTQEDR